MPQESTTDRQNHAAFILALQQLPGVGRVTISRIIEGFDSYETLLSFPREQVLVRLKGLPRSSGLVNTLFDRPGMEARFEQAQKLLGQLRPKRIEVVAEGDDRYPDAFTGLVASRRPNILYTFGNPAALGPGALTMIAQPPLGEAAFGLAQRIADLLGRRRAKLISSLSNGFDVAIHKRYGAVEGAPAPLAIADCGLSRLGKSLRPAAMALVRSGGLIMSGFEMEHGPYPHDVVERGILQMALSKTGVFVEPRPDTFEWEVLQWTTRHRGSAFAVVDGPVDLPDGIHPLREPDDLGWLEYALEREHPIGGPS